ncbi:MAG TPA: rhomboid family intramembrane serine protease, partial [Tepidisphaeraceae bacterium]|nr:rhomboid family intramembrane serine protease [Tepidisphaeraceae bacterium]
MSDSFIQTAPPPAPPPPPPPAAAAGPRRPWESPDLFPLIPTDGQYGFIRRQIPVSCTLEQLRQTIAHGWGPLPLVWTPASRRVVPAVEAASLFDVVKPRLMKKTIASAAGWALLGAGLAAAVVLTAKQEQMPADQAKSMAWTLLVFLGIVPMAMTIRSYQVLATFTVRDMIAHGRVARYQAWLRRRWLVTTWFVAACILVVFACQLKAGVDLSAVLCGLVKPLPRGQWWRLLTMALMHGGFIHIAVNLTSLVILGRLVEAHSRPAYLPIVFVLSAIAGSLASLKFGPVPGTTVGASGGLMGLIGFMAVMGYRRRSVLPGGFLQIMIANVFLIGLMGSTASNVIDNACHFGGLAAGVVIGLIVFANGPARRAWQAANGIALLAMLLLAAACAKAVTILWNPTEIVLTAPSAPLPPYVPLGHGVFDATARFSARYAPEVEGKFQIRGASRDESGGQVVNTIRGVFQQPGLYVFKFDEFDRTGFVYQSRSIRVQVAPNAEPLPMLICPDDSMWNVYPHAMIATRPRQIGIVQWTEDSPD